MKVEPIILALPDNSIVEMDTETIPNMKKTHNPYYGKIIKKAKNLVKVNYNYENEVNNQLIKEGKAPTFKSQDRVRWEKPYTDKTILTHEWKTYLQVIVLKTLTENYYYNGSEIAEQQIKQYLIKEYLPKNILLDTPIIIRTPREEHITNIVI